jgi:transposase InsO family protein
MPWNNRGVMTLREEFIAKVKSKKYKISQLCQEYNISRPTAYKWINRYTNEGNIGLLDRNTRPFHMPSKIDLQTVELILSLRDKYPAWGAKKLRQILINQGQKNLPCLSSFNRILSCEDRISAIESEKRQKFIRFEKENPNELWQMDFKGYFRTSEGQCHPLTLLDDCSRYSLCLKACASESEGAVRSALEEVFSCYGLPEAMTMDNGSPWKGYPNQRLSTITVWLMRLGIKIGHSRPNHPQTQGKDERFHRTFKEEVLKYHNFKDLLDAQDHFNEWRQIYNNIRPHEAIGMLCPVQKYRLSEKKYSKTLPKIEYLDKDKVLKVAKNGEICFKGKRYYVGSHLKGEYVALREKSEDKWDIYYVNSRLGGFK